MTQIDPPTLYLFSAVICAVLFFYSGRFWKAPATLPLMLLFCCGGVWALCDAFFLTSTDESAKIFWLNVKITPINLAALAFLTLSIRHTTQKRWWNWHALGALAIVPAIISYLSLTNSPLFREHIEFIRSGGAATLKLINGPWFTIHVLYGHLIWLASLAILVLSMRGVKSFFRRQTLAMLGAVLLLAIVDVATNLRLLSMFDPLPVVFSVLGVFIAWMLFHYRLLDVTPIARARTLENMADLMLVIDSSGRLVDFNHAAENAFAIDAKKAVGQPLDEVLSHAPELVDALSKDSCEECEIRVQQNGETQVYRAVISPIDQSAKNSFGKLALLHDVSDRSRAEFALQQANAKLVLQLREIKRLEANLREQVVRDPLTNLFNRRYLSETLPHEIARATRNDYPLGVILADIDHFKQLNDTYGHEAGDVVLQELGAYLLAHCRAGDIACRYGGEEFLIVLPGLRQIDAERRANELQAGLALIRAPLAGFEIQFTLSMGVAVFPLHGETANQVIRAADQALYEAKSAGRSRVVAV